MSERKKALLLVDLQNDFFPGGALGVKGSEALFPLVNDLQNSFPLIIATQDWHSSDHKSFASNHPGAKTYDVIRVQGIEQVLWPDHCVQNSVGAQFHPKLKTEYIQCSLRFRHQPIDPDHD